MSFLRFAANPRVLTANVRRYASTAAPKKPTDWAPAVAVVAGLGMVGWLYYVKGGEVYGKKVQEKSPLDPDNFVDFKLKRVDPYNHNTAKYTFELPRHEASLLPIASCVIVKSSNDSPAPLNGPNGKPVIRPYTPVSPSDKEGELTFMIKRYEEGQMSQYIHGLKPGDKLAIKGPIMKIPYKKNEWDEVGMIAGGSGITPMYQVLQHALAEKGNKTRFTLIFANVAPSDILLKEEFDAWKKKYPDTFNVVYTVDKADDSWKGPVGYVNKELIQQHIPPASLGEKVKIMICGPPGQVAALAGKKDGMKQGTLAGTLKDLGYSEDQVFKF